jgi:putative toxin-antitoxin system antitoxin component (TIGR02293 family)
MHTSVTLSTVLGGNIALGKVKNRMDLVQFSNKGVSRQMIVQLGKYLHLSLKQIAALLPVSERTIQRNTSFNQAISDQILCIAEVAVKGTQVFESQNKFIQWLNTPAHALSNYTPLSLLNSKIGMDLVVDEIGRIEHGIYS